MEGIYGPPHSRIQQIDDEVWHAKHPTGPEVGAEYRVRLLAKQRSSLIHLEEKELGFEIDGFHEARYLNLQRKKGIFDILVSQVLATKMRFQPAFIVRK